MRKKHLSPTKKKKKKRKITKRNGMFEASTAAYIYIYIYIYIASKKKQKQSVIQLLANYSMKLLRSSSIGDPN
jgi:hypothetical protein